MKTKQTKIDRAGAKLLPGAMALAATAASSQAATVQITLTGNKISTTGGNQLVADLTGDGVDDITFVNPSVSSTGVIVNVGGGQWGANAGYSSSYAANAKLFGSAPDIVRGTSPRTATALNAITFTDSRVNGGAATQAWLEVHAFNTSQTEHTVEFTRLIFDDASTTRPVFTEIPGVQTEWAAAGVPEPSSFGMLALGAGVFSPAVAAPNRLPNHTKTFPAAESRWRDETNTTHMKTKQTKINRSGAALLPGAMALAATTASSQAAVVQITLLNNKISSTGGNQLIADLTGDGVADITLSNAFAGTAKVAVYVNSTGSVSAGFELNTVIIGGFPQFWPKYKVDALFSWAGVGSSRGSGLLPQSATYLNLITFQDSRINGDAVTNAWLEVHAFNTSRTDHTVELTRLIFDDSSTTRPVFTNIPGTQTEWGAVPEPSSFGMLALGAGVFSPAVAAPSRLPEPAKLSPPPISGGGMKLTQHT